MRALVSPSKTRRIDGILEARVELVVSPPTILDPLGVRPGRHTRAPEARAASAAVATEATG